MLANKDFFIGLSVGVVLTMVVIDTWGRTEVRGLDNLASRIQAGALSN